MTALSIEARLQALEDERDVLATMYRYAYALDYGVREDFLDCFTESGIWESRRQDERRTLMGRYVGLAELAGFFDRHTHAPETWHKHLLSEPRVRVDGDNATAESYFWRTDEHAAEAYMPGFGRYKDRLIRCEDGRWRFSERNVELEWWRKRA